MIPAVTFNDVFNHLWQSTLFAAVAGMTTLALKQHHARARYGLWLAASVKFLIPFSFFVGIGTHLASAIAPARTQTGLLVVMDLISRPFPRVQIPVTTTVPYQAALPIIPALLLGAWLCGCAIVLLWWWVRWRRMTAIARSAVPLREGREIEALHRLQRVAKAGKHIELRSSTDSMEPGVFGMLRPVLLLPAGIPERLGDAQLDAILAHELSHVRRWDNLAAAGHMIVEALFWFHPLVWWLGARLVEERERACDEEVLRLGSEPQVYAEGILKVCQFYVESPLVCVAGITGSNLKRRIETIMTHRLARKLDVSRKLLLVAIGAASVAGPVLIGLMNPPQSRAELHAEVTAPLSFETVSLKPNTSGGRQVSIFRSTDGRLTATNATLRWLMTFAYDVRDHQIPGGPPWINFERYDLVAKAEGKPDTDQFRSMLRALLANRFKLAVHREMKELSTYALLVGRNGPKMHEAESGQDRSRKMLRLGHGHLAGDMLPIAFLAQGLSDTMGCNVVDKTGLEGVFNLKLDWMPDAPKESRASVFRAVEEQLGLELVAQKSPVEILTVDHAEKASAN